MRSLFQSVIWPAVAGNVIWSLLTVATGTTRSEPGFWPQIIALFFVALYLAADWVSINTIVTKLSNYYWIADIFLAAAISTFAISTEAGKPWAKYALGAVFIVAAIGDLLGVWVPAAPAGKSKGAWGRRLTLTAFNLLGVAILLGGEMFNYARWSPAIASGVVVLFYFVFTRRYRWSSAPQRGADSQVSGEIAQPAPAPDC